MKLPRWLSPVRMVEAETGWPRPLCRRLAYSAVVQRAGAMADGVMFAVTVWMIACGLVAGFMAGRSLAEWQPAEALHPALLMTIGLALGVIWSGFPVAMSLDARKRARKYMAAPWCFKCKYPIPPPREGRSYSICPECGEPIPPEIARLAADRVMGEAKG